MTGFVLCVVVHNVGTLTSNIEPDDVDLYSKAAKSVSKVCL